MFIVCANVQMVINVTIIIYIVLPYSHVPSKIQKVNLYDQHYTEYNYTKLSISKLIYCKYITDKYNFFYRNLHLDNIIYN